MATSSCASRRMNTRAECCPACDSSSSARNARARFVKCFSNVRSSQAWAAMCGRPRRKSADSGAQAGWTRHGLVPCSDVGAFAAQSSLMQPGQWQAQAKRTGDQPPASSRLGAWRLMTRKSVHPGGLGSHTAVAACRGSLPECRARCAARAVSGGSGASTRPRSIARQVAHPNQREF